MRTLRTPVLVVGLLLAAAAAGQDGPVVKKGGRLPPGWSKLLKLDGAQAAKIREIDRVAREEVARLTEQARRVREKARRDQLAVLTPAQRKVLAGEEGGKPVGGGKGKSGE